MESLILQFEKVTVKSLEDRLKELKEKDWSHITIKKDRRRIKKKIQRNIKSIKKQIQKEKTLDINYLISSLQKIGF
jgi:hypothetical protein